jgi:hypothetical protein
MPKSASPSAIALALTASAKTPYSSGPSRRVRKMVSTAVSDAVVSWVA